MRYFIARTEGRGDAEIAFPAGDDQTRLAGPGDRVLFFQLRGDGENSRGLFVAWGEIERVGAGDNGGVASLKSVAPFKRPVLFSELRADPRRSRDAGVQPISPEVFNQVLGKSRR